MFVTFFHELKSAGVPVTLREYLTLMEAMNADIAGRRVEDFYYLSRAALIKDERNLDKFDRVFGHDLVAAGIDHRGDAAIGEAQRERQQVEARHRDHRDAERLRDRLMRRRPAGR